MREECRPLRPFTQTGVHVIYCTSVAHRSNRSAVFAQANQVVHASIVYLFLLPSVLSSSAFQSYFFLCKSYCTHIVFGFCLFRFLESLLRQASNALIVQCPTLHCFVNQSTESEPSFRADEFSDVAGQTQSSLQLISSHFFFPDQEVLFNL